MLKIVPLSGTTQKFPPDTAGDAVVKRCVIERNQALAWLSNGSSLNAGAEILKFTLVQGCGTVKLVLLKRIMAKRESEIEENNIDNFTFTEHYNSGRRRTGGSAHYQRRNIRRIREK